MKKFHLADHKYKSETDPSLGTGGHSVEMSGGHGVEMSHYVEEAEWLPGSSDPLVGSGMAFPSHCHTE